MQKSYLNVAGPKLLSERARRVESKVVRHFAAPAPAFMVISDQPEPNRSLTSFMLRRKV